MFDGLKPMFTDKFSQICSTFVVSIANIFQFSPIEISRVYLLQNGLLGENISGFFAIWRNFILFVRFRVWLEQLLYYGGHL